MSRTTLRNDDVLSADATQRPLNEALRDVSIRFDSQPRRFQTWLRFTTFESDGVSSIVDQLIKGPDYAVGACVVLACVIVGTSVAPLTAAPWLSVEPVDGQPGTMRVTEAFGLPQTGTFDVLVEFVENVTEAWPRTDVTEGTP